MGGDSSVESATSLSWAFPEGLGDEPTAEIDHAFHWFHQMTTTPQTLVSAHLNRPPNPAAQTLAEVGSLLGVSRERVRQIEAASLAILRPLLGSIRAGRVRAADRAGGPGSPASSGRPTQDQSEMAHPGFRAAT